MAERVVDILEIIDIDKQQGKTSPAGPVAKQMVETQREGEAIGKPRQNIVMRQIFRIGLNLAALADVLVGDDPPTFRHGHIDHLNRTFVGLGIELAAFALEPDVGQALVDLADQQHRLRLPLHRDVQ